VGPKAGLDDVEKRKFLTLPGLELRPLGGLARSQSLYRLRSANSVSKVSGIRDTHGGRVVKCVPMNVKALRLLKRDVDGILQLV
jgi:hypothetical protein